MTKVKICGVKTVGAIKAAVQSGVDFIGFVFAESKRQISLSEARYLAYWIPSYVRKVGVFVSPSLEELEKAITEVPLDLVQIHGDFDAQMAEKVTVPIIRAVHLSSPKTVWDEKQQQYLLFDAPVAGSGHIFDWESLDVQKIRVPYFVAGGLHVDNVKEAIKRFNPYAVDVSTGVETEGIKDTQKIKAFIEKVKYDL